MSDPVLDDLVLAEHHGDVLLLTLNRPDRLNAWTNDLEDRYFAVLDEADADPGTRAVVVTGAGRGFCAGADLENLQQASTSSSDTPDTKRPRERPLFFRKPLIAAINGAAVGLGLIEALYCDVRFCTPTAKLGTAFAQRGLIAEYGIAWLLPRLIGRSHALDLLLSARLIRGDEALSMGLVDRIVEPEALLDTAIGYATELATLCSPTSISIIKDQVLRAMDGDLPTAITLADTLMHESFRHPDAAEGVTSFLEKRPPRFQPVS
jgi:enoyl-CoA hydratase/carnithine racemase